jgi:hypothetical protein
VPAVTEQLITKKEEIVAAATAGVAATYAGVTAFGKKALDTATAATASTKDSAAAATTVATDKAAAVSTSASEAVPQASAAITDATAKATTVAKDTSASVVAQADTLSKSAVETTTATVEKGKASVVSATEGTFGASTMAALGLTPEAPAAEAVPVAAPSAVVPNAAAPIILNDPAANTLPSHVTPPASIAPTAVDVSAPATPTKDVESGSTASPLKVKKAGFFKKLFGNSPKKAPVA